MWRTYAYLLSELDLQRAQRRPVSARYDVQRLRNSSSVRPQDHLLDRPQQAATASALIAILVTPSGRSIRRESG